MSSLFPLCSGVLLISLALCADAAIGNVQEKAMKEHLATNREVVSWARVERRVFVKRRGREEAEEYVSYWVRDERRVVWREEERRLVELTLTRSLLSRQPVCLQIMGFDPLSPVCALLSPSSAGLLLLHNGLFLHSSGSGSHRGADPCCAILLDCACI